VYSVYSAAGLKEFVTRDRAMATHRIKIITHAESDSDKLMPKDVSSLNENLLSRDYRMH
jgi:hypothetical protein